MEQPLLQERALHMTTGRLAVARLVGKGQALPQTKAGDKPLPYALFFSPQSHEEYSDGLSFPCAFVSLWCKILCLSSILNTMPIKLIAHRGYTARYPENTIIAIEAAIEAGAQFVEVDVQLAADGTPVLFHDRTLERMCGVSGAIADYSPRQLAGFSASEPERFGDTFVKTPIATLKELAALIRRSPDVHFFIELKQQKKWGQVLNRAPPDSLSDPCTVQDLTPFFLLKQTSRALDGLQEQCTLISFDAAILAMARLRGWRTGIVVEDYAQYNQPASTTDFLFCDVDGLPPSGDLHPRDTRLAVYEVADPERARRLAARGVDFIETFAIGEMLVALSKS